ncbi:MAG: CDP-alcohol phosphatidyltransferase family protein [Candidatus Omnitrophica bacterium]|nr:CDP-alcohol phosphatidyltransferase family protein [Candidatus Omnitrophota bacterium]MDD5352321.1 CDP-alcohol phosphatidyltransferase family protein [Candidatus Omnitrophota bacterium]MDD5549919.1 CDP-alcohol phosphatidyltransferase family protein [Candidatus Omnitrophota bacterium]
MSFANKITIFRILSVPFLITTLVYYTPQKDYLRLIALFIFALAIISDAIDGYFARVRNQKTQAGAILDPLADKFLLITAFIFLYHISNQYFDIKLPLWVILIVIFRDVILLLGGGIIILTNQENKIMPTWWGKTSTFFQMMTILFLLLKLNLSYYIWNIAVIFTLISGIDYLRKGIVMFNAQPQKK